MEWILMNPEYAASTGKQYITIVNLTPHRFKLDHTHSYQMSEFNFDDIPPGRARQNIAHYTEKGGTNPVDDNGEAYYNIEGTDKKFIIRATTHIPDLYPQRTVVDLSGMDLGQREYMDPEQETPVTLVITGSEKYGFITSLTHGPGNWMRRPHLYDVIKDRHIQHIIMPGTHDSGMSTISGHLLSGGSPTNTQTQGLNIYDQLRAGARWFDLRIASIHQTTPNEGDYGFWTTHVNNELAEVPIGNTGEGLSDIIQEINHFTAENPGEVIFFRLKYLVGIRKVPSLGPIHWGQDIIDDFFSQLKKVNNRCGNLNVDVSFEKRTASFFMDQNNGNGCVIFLLDGDLKRNIERTDDGIYSASRMAFWDYWSEKQETESMANAEIAAWKSVSRTGDASDEKDQFLIGQWLVSAAPLSIAIFPTNPALYWAGVNSMSPENWPNVLMVDYIGVILKDQFNWASLGAELYTLAIGLNLYMISENCGISKHRSPLLPHPSSSRMANINSLTRLTSMTKPWNGIIFANGTVLENPPPSLHPGRVEILKKGTVFNNGTVLEASIPNPDT
ncbi:PLC-like phosphodiesterase [Aspergillus novofumigatus IBT 16806]|uniref:PLC-like phosphodiesterase n=1 Tax=Aspergillus novofumigatus (strain IBT 16806) TaxID=1392255 RepID=A0A2I1C5G6_ASPN1|nr:PLC-like phosphodiesterase [Aspergillus novofumigatus IBT 16806]PKX92852.1 PLC-like phosphodiesterase [Aspergillus novofumigatus IBT 16806]